MAEQKIVKTVSYEVQETDLSQAIRDDPPAEELRQEVVRLLNVVQEAKDKRSASTVILDESAVPAPPQATRGCPVCEYVRVVNYQTVEIWPPIKDRAIGGCGSCGIQVKSTVRVVNYKVVEEIVETWRLIQP